MECACNAYNGRVTCTGDGSGGGNASSLHHHHHGRLTTPAGYGWNAIRSVTKGAAGVLHVTHSRNRAGSLTAHVRIARVA